MANINLNIGDLQTDSMPSFRGIAGQFFEQTATYINYAAPVNSQITRTPQNKAQVAKMQQIVRRIRTPTQRPAIGNSMARSQIQESAYMDQTANNSTVIKDYAMAIMREMISTDVQYHKLQLYGTPDYLQRQQKCERLIPGGLIHHELLQRNTSAKQSNYQYSRGQFSSRGSVPLKARGSIRSSQQSKSVPQLHQHEVIQQKDILKGVDYICQVIFKEAYCLETEYFAVSLFHRTLSRLQIRKSELKLLAAVCIFIATKHEENYGEALGTGALVAYFGNTFTVSQMLQAEMRLLDSINWRMGVSATNARSYLRTLYRDLGFSLQMCVLSSYIAELTLMDQQFLQFSAFEIALASIELAVVSAAQQPFDGVHTVHFTVNKIFMAMAAVNQQGRSSCKQVLNNFWGEITKNGTMTQVFKKYAEENYFKVSLRGNIKGDLAEEIERCVELV